MRFFSIFTVGYVAASGVFAQSIPQPVSDADFSAVDQVEAALGQLLFYDAILSGNRNISCASCHHPALGTGDGLSLGLGEGGQGIGPGRVVDPQNPPEQRIPRNAQALFNLGAHEFTVLFHDGRIEQDTSRPSGLRTPMGEDMMQGFASLLSAQTMFPVLSQDEMSGHYSENDVAQAVRQGRITGTGGAWDVIARRVGDVPEYAQSFTAVYPHIVSAQDIAFTDISNAIAAFIEWEWRSDTSPFDTYLRTGAALPETATQGMELFYGKAGCAACHSGPFLTDHSFHAVGATQIGPGKAARFESHSRDLGRARVTGQDADSYAFRTPSLRNVALSGPYGHAGAVADLRTFVASHVQPVVALQTYDPTTAILPEFEADDFVIFNSVQEVEAISQANSLTPVALSEAEIDALVAFLNSLTDPIARVGRLGIPQTVPSGLPVEPLAQP